MTKKLLALGALLTICAYVTYAIEKTVWADKEFLKTLMVEDDRAQGIMFPVQELYDYLIEKVALQKIETADVSFQQQKAIPNMTKSDNNQFEIGSKDAGIQPLMDWVNNKTYRIQLPSEFGNIKNIFFTPDNAMIIISLMLLPIGFVCGFSTRYDEVYDRAYGNKLFLPPIFQIRLANVVSAWIENDNLVIWADNAQQYYYSHPTMKKYYYSLPLLHEFNRMFTNVTTVTLLSKIQNARKLNDPLALTPDQLKTYNSFSPGIKQALKPFIA